MSRSKVILQIIDMKVCSKGLHKAIIQYIAFIITKELDMIFAGKENPSIIFKERKDTHDTSQITKSV